MKVQKIKNSIRFSAFTEQQVQELLGVKEELKENLLKNWEDRADKMVVTAEDQKLIDRLHAKLKLYVRSWNEEDLKLKFIGHLIELVNFDDYEKRITAFSERSLAITYNDLDINGVVDLMVATGLSTPRHPFFFIHEYKKEQPSSGDPVGQLLSTMFVAKELNGQKVQQTLFNKGKDFSDIPIYGVYVSGRNWVFVILIDNKYYLSSFYDSTKMTDLLRIVQMLKAQKRNDF